MPELVFVTGEPALVINQMLVIADIHIGIEYEYRRSGIHIPSQTEKLINKLETLIKKTKAKRLVILGDVKHKVPGISFQEEREVPVFLKHVSEKVPIDIVPGNHDSGLKDYLSENVKLHSSKGFRHENVFFSHGHAWPDKGFLETKYLLMGHVHPAAEFTDKLGYKWSEPVWVKAKIKKQELERQYKTKLKTTPEVVVFPAFNEFAGRIAINKPLREIDLKHKTGPPSPIFRICKLKEARTYLLDGTCLGKLGNLQ